MLPNTDKLSILLASSEALPFSKTGGLADVLKALPEHLALMGMKVTLVTPFYRKMNVGHPEPFPVFPGFNVKMGNSQHNLNIYKTTVNNQYEVYFVAHSPSFGRAGLYGPPGGEYKDNVIRFALFSRAVVELAGLLGEEIDLIHCHDWQTALVPFYGRGSNMPTVFTIHNLGYQGIFDKSFLPRIGIPEEYFHPEGLEFFGRLNFMKAGIVWSSAFTTVSPQYSLEIQEPEYGFGLDGLLRKYSSKLTGILNGVDYSSWDPGKDPYIIANYDHDHLEGKRTCKEDLLSIFGLERKRDFPLIGVVTRLAQQKGVDLILEALPELMAMNLCLIILGSGQPELEKGLKAAMTTYPNLKVRLGFDEKLAHKIEAGADIFLMPSRYEPCGLNQIYSMRYGTVPVVRATGGLKDTVTPYESKTGQGVGFSFPEASAASLAGAVKDALDHWKNPRVWRIIMKNGMAADFSWVTAASRYADLYREIIASKE